MLPCCCWVFLAVETLTSTMRNASDAPNLATGQEFFATLLQNTPIVSTRKVAEPKHSLVPSSEVFDEEINEIT